MMETKQHQHTGALIYARVSTHEQHEKGVSLDAQIERCKAYCTAKDWTIVEIIEDTGESGKNLHRPGVQKILKMLADGQANMLVMMKLDRLTRNVQDLGTILEKKERDGWDFSSVQDSLDTSTATGRLQLNVLISVSQWEREVIAERTASALSHKRNNGEKTGGSRQFGYDVMEKGGKKLLTSNPDEQDAIGLIVRLRKSGRTLKHIAEELHKRGIGTATGNPRWNLVCISRICHKHGLPTGRKPRKDRGKHRRADL